jgi:hypothetical protein
VRLVVRNDAEQVEVAEKFIAGGAWVSHLVLAETVALHVKSDKIPELKRETFTA